MIALAVVEIESLVEMELPPLPVVAMRVSELTQDLNSSTRTIADAIGCDPILAARILRVANSPLYCIERSVTALPMAVNALGNEKIHSLIFVSMAADAFKGRRSPLEIKLWEHSLAVGLAAREIMSLLGLRGVEEGFLCGLLHDFGKLLLLRYNLPGYEELLRDTDEQYLLAGEKELFGYTHQQVGAIAAKRWELPGAISNAIHHHHQPSQAHESMLMARVVDVADALANQAGLGLRLKAEGELINSESVIALQLTQNQLDEVWNKTHATVAATSSIFGQN